MWTAGPWPGRCSSAGRHEVKRERQPGRRSGLPPGKRPGRRPVREHAAPRGEAAAGPSQKLQKALAGAGLGSRREIETWIAAGRVTVNGRVASIGERVGGADRVAVDGRPVRLDRPGERPKVLLYHKPAGEIVSRHDPQERPSVFDQLPRLRGSKWISVGRLDFNTEGLLILTNSGDLANRLMHPRYGMEREYAVRVLGELSQDHLARLQQGVRLEDGVARFEQVEPSGGSGANRWYRVVLMEGRYREVRRAFEALGFTVSRLIRVRFGGVVLPASLRRGRHLELDDGDVDALMAATGAAPAVSPPAGASAPARASRVSRRQGQAQREDRPAGVGKRTPPRKRSRPN